MARRIDYIPLIFSLSLRIFPFLFPFLSPRPKNRKIKKKSLGKRMEDNDFPSVAGRIRRKLLTDAWA